MNTSRLESSVESLGVDLRICFESESRKDAKGCPINIVDAILALADSVNSHSAALENHGEAIKEAGESIAAAIRETTNGESA